MQKRARLVGKGLKAYFEYIYFHFSISGEEMAKYLTRMCLQSEVVDGGKNVKVEVPPIRAGIL